MDVYIDIENRVVKAIIDSGECIEDFTVDDEPVDCRTDNPDSNFIAKHIVQIQEEVAYKIRERQTRFVGKPRHEMLGTWRTVGG